MKKCWLLLIMVVPLSYSALGQIDSTYVPQTGYSMPYEKHKLMIGPYMTVVNMQDFSPKMAFGADAEYMVGKQFGFGSVLGVGQNYAEFSGSILGLLGLAVPSSGDPRGLFFLVLLPFMFENPHFHFKPYKNQEFVVSLSLMKFRYNYANFPEYGDDFFTSGSIALRYSVFFRDRWQWSVFLEGTKMYHYMHPTGFQFGFAIRHVSRKEVR